jgi:hypothetical protein
MLKKKILVQFTKNFLIKIMGLGSGIRKKPIPDPGYRGQKGTGSRILDPSSRSATLSKIHIVRLSGFGPYQAVCTLLGAHEL